MESKKRTDWDELIAVGVVSKPQGRRGELLVRPVGGDVAHFEELTHVYLEIAPGEGSALSVGSCRIHKGRPVLVLEGITDIGQAEALRGKELRVSRDSLGTRPDADDDDNFYHFDLVGLRVVDGKHGEIGVVEDVLSTGGTDVLVVRRPRGEETLVPFCREICVRIDPGEGLIELDAPEGLVELNAN